MWGQKRSHFKNMVQNDISRRIDLRDHPHCSKTYPFGKETLSLWAFWFSFIWTHNPVPKPQN